MKCFINGKEFNVVEGATFSEEYNEKLDSGAIILSQVEKQDFKPYQDVYVMSDEDSINVIPDNKYNYFEFKINLINQTITYQNETSVDMASNTTITFPSTNNRITGEGISDFLHYSYLYTGYDDNVAPYEFGDSIFLKVRYEVLSNGYTLENVFSCQTHLQKINPDGDTFINFGLIPTYYGFSGIVNKNLTEITFNNPLYIYNRNTGEQYARILDISIESGRNVYTKRDVYFNQTLTVNFDAEALSSFNRLTRLDLITANRKITYNDGREVEERLRVSKGTSNTTFTLDDITFNLNSSNLIYTGNAVKPSKTLLNQYIKSIEYSNFSFSCPSNSSVETPKFYRHLLIDSFSEERLNLVENLYKYKITLMGETKYLEKIQCPNLSITQPLNFSKKKSIYDYLVQYLELFNPKIKVATHGDANTFVYMNKYSLDNSLRDKFSDIIAPDFSLNNPTFRDLLNQLMIVRDCIPIVKDNVISCLDLTATKGTFNTNKVNYIESSLSSEDYTNNLKKNYNDGLSTQNARYVEKLGFRNSEQGLMTLENMRIETRYPIYKVNKMYMCYYKKFALYTSASEYSEYIMLVKQDITPLVKLNSERNLLTNDWLDLPSNIPPNINDASKYKMLTIGYDIGSNFITGWGTIYSYPIENSWFDTTKSYIENIVNYIDNAYPFGINNGETIKQINKDGKSVATIGDWFDSVVVPNSPQSLQTSDPLKMKCLFFEIDYNSFYSGTIIHSKDNDFGLLTSNDNPSSSLSLLESDGSFEKEKLNRIGNKIYQINARYDSVEELQELGSVFEDDNVIYHREYSIYNNLVKCNYYATKDYVMKNYFTSIWAKHRTYNLMSYNESIVRAENRKMFLYLSSNELYNDFKNQVFSFDNFNNEVDYELMTAFIPNEIMTSLNNYILENNINGGTINDNFSDINVFTSGTSLIFNVRMFDNVSGGVKINQIAPDAGIIDTNDDYTKGSTQQWLMSVDDIETGQIEEIDIEIAHIDNRELFKETPFAFNQAEVNQIYETYLYNLPSALNMTTNITNVIKFNKNIYKDNKELLDFTFQFEPITKDKDIDFSNLLFGLNNLSNFKYKNEVDYQVSDTSLEQNNILMYYSSIDNFYIKGQDLPTYTMGTIVINIPENVSLNVGDIVYFSYTYNCSYSKSGLAYYAYLYINNIKIVSITDTMITCTANLILQRYEFNPFNQKITLKEILGNKEVEFNLYRYSYTETLETYERKPSKDADGYKSYGNALQVESFLENGVSIESINSGSFINGIYDMTYETNDYNYASYIGNSTFDVNKNMFVFYRTSGNIKDSKYINEFSESSIPNGLVKTDLNISNVFQLMYNQSLNYSYLTINLSELSYFDNITPATIEYWFYDEDSESYKFVFGVNLDSSKRKTIVFSLLNNSDFNVVDDKRQPIGTIFNYRNHGIKINSYHLIDKNV